MRDGWRRVTLGEIADVYGGGTPSTKTPDFWGGDIPWITPTEVVAQDGKVISRTERTITRLGLDRSGARLLPARTVLVTSRATVGAIALAGVPIAINQGFAGLLCHDDVLPEWLMFWCQGSRDEFRFRAGGSTFPEVSRSNVRAIPILVPPLHDQRRIIDLVTHLDDACTGLQAEATSARILRDSLARDHFRSCLSDRLPLGEVARVAQGASLPKSWQGMRSGAVPWFKISDMTAPWNEFRLTSAVTKVSVGQMSQRGVSPWTAGTVVFPRVGAAILTEKKRILAVDALCDENHLAVLPTPAFVPEYMLAFFENMQLASLVQAGAVPSLNMGLIRSLHIPVPPLSEQRRLTSAFEAARGVEEHAGRALQRAELLRTAILGQLLSGACSIPNSYDRFIEAAS